MAQSFPWPYNGMVRDILGAIRTKGNYLAAMGLAAYTEICGRQILFGGKKNVKDWKCFNEFLVYMGLQELLDKKIIYHDRKIYFKDAVRNGLIHEFFMKVERGGVAMFLMNKSAMEFGFIIKEPDTIIMVVVPYFKIFCNALKKAQLSGKLIWHKP